MLNWLREKVSSRDLGSSIPATSPGADGGHSSYDSLSKDDTGSPIDSLSSASGRSTLVVVRDAAVPKMTLESNDLQLLHDIPEFKPLLHDIAIGGVTGAIDTKALINICKIYQDHLHTCSQSVSVEQSQLTARMKEVDATIKVLMDRLQDRQKAYARCADQLKKTPDITQSLKRLRFNIKETEEMLRQLNVQLPPDLRLEPFHFVEGRQESEEAETPTDASAAANMGNKIT